MRVKMRWKLWIGEVHILEVVDRGKAKPESLGLRSRVE